MGSELAVRLVELLSKAGLTLCTAESCTGGQIAAAITAIPGSSKVFLGGVVAYANTAKVSLLGIQEATLAEHGAVSEQVAIQMALGAQQRFGADFAVSTTGIAGPGGGTLSKPVGLVCIAWAGLQGVDSASFNFAGSRSEVQAETVHEALLGILARLS